MRTYVLKNNPKAPAEQAPAVQFEVIYLGCDLHKQSITVTRILDHGTPQPAQRFTWQAYFEWVQKQTALGKKVYAVYEAGAFGFWVARKLKDLKVECYVVHPEKLDPRQKRVQTDKLDSRHLADKLQRYVLGNRKAMVPVYIPTPQEEQKRLAARHRQKLSQQMLALQARGRGLLLSQGIFQNGRWWTDREWEPLQGRLSPELQGALADDRALIVDYQKRLHAADKQLEATAPKELPKGFGRLSFVLLLSELCNYQRFKSRRNVGGFTGLCGGVSSSGDYHLDLSINKAGSPYVRTLLIELAWRVVYWQPQYRGLRVWKRFCGGTRPVHKRRRKIAIVALARQLAVDLWRWQTGTATVQELGWEMTPA